MTTVPNRFANPAASPLPNTITALSNTALGLIVGLVLGLAAAFGGFGAFLTVLVLGAAGFGVGRFLDGQFDLSAMSGRGRDHLR